MTLIYTLKFFPWGGDTLALEEVKEIKKAEEEAAGIIKSAESKGRDILRTAQKDASSKYDETLLEIKNKAKALVDEAVSLGEKNAAKVFESGKKDVDSILNVHEEKLNTAVKLIIERIVMNNGDS